MLINFDIQEIDHILDKLNNIKFSTKLMKNGLVFIWVQKTRIWELIQLMERKGFEYVENLVCCLFDADKLRDLIDGLKAQIFGFDQKEHTKYTSINKIADFLLTKEFDLDKRDKIDNYLYEEHSGLISINKRTLLIFRRVS